MDHIGSRQIKAARALLDWSQDDLSAATGLSIATIRKLELGYISPRNATVSVLRKTFEDAGIEFLEPEGVRRRREDIATYQGSEALDAFFEDMSRHTILQGSEIFIVADETFGVRGVYGPCMLSKMENFLRLNPAISIKVILTAGYHLIEFPLGMQCRFLSTNYVDPMPYSVYADRYAMMTVAEEKTGRVVVVKSKAAAQASRRHFYSMWDKAMNVSGSVDLQRTSSVSGRARR